MSDVSACVARTPSHEGEFRRDEFLGGLPVRLSDGQEWALAGPRELSVLKPSMRAQVLALVTEIGDAEDEAERLRGELALAIRLLTLNYELPPAMLMRLLTFKPGDATGAEFQAKAHELTVRHAEAFWPAEQAPAANQGRRFRFPAFLPHRRFTRRVGRSQKAS